MDRYSLIICGIIAWIHVEIYGWLDIAWACGNSSSPLPKPGRRLFSAYGARNEDIYLNALAAKDVLPLASAYRWIRVFTLCQNISQCAEDSV